MGFYNMREGIDLRYLFILFSILILMGAGMTAAVTHTCNDCSTCEAAINSANPGDIVELTGNITDHTGSCIEFKNNNVTFDCTGHKIDGDRSSSALRGIYMNEKTGNAVRNCVITDFRTGIMLYKSSNNEITSNTVNSNVNNGIWLEESTDNTIAGNTVNSNGVGIRLSDSNDNTITSNIVTLNFGDAIFLWSSDNNEILLNEVNSYNDRGISLLVSHNNRIIQNTADSNGDTGIFLTNSDDNEITDNSVNSNRIGIELYSSDNNELTSNIVCGNSGDDIYVSASGSSYGDDNTCGKPDGWDDDGTTGCTNPCGAYDAPPKISVVVDPGTTIHPMDPITITATGTDDKKVESVVYDFPSSPDEKCDISFPPPHNCPGTDTCVCGMERVVGSGSAIDTLLSTPGTHTIYVYAVDNASQESLHKPVTITVVEDKLPEIIYFNATPNPVYVDAKVAFTIEAIDDYGLKNISLEDVSTGNVIGCDCSYSKTCSTDTCTCLTTPLPPNFLSCFEREFPLSGNFTFCAYATDDRDQDSIKVCLNVSVITVSECTPIKLNDGISDVTIAIKMHTKRIYEDELGLGGLPADCSDELGYTKSVVINNEDCGYRRGSLQNSDYAVKIFDPGENITFENFTYPIILCSNVLEDNKIAVGVVEGAIYQPVNFVGSTPHSPGGITKYWLVEATEPLSTPYIFIPNSENDAITKIRTSDCSEACNIPVGDNPSRLAIGLNGEVWVGNRNSNDVTRIDGSTCDVIDTYDVGIGPRGIAIDGDGNVWVGNCGDGSVWKLDGTTGDCLIGDPARNPTCPIASSPINIGGCPYGAAVDCLGNLFVVDRPDHLVKINTSDATVLWNKYIASQLYGIAVDYDENVWLGGYTSGKVYKVDGDTGTILCSSNNLGADTTGVAIDHDNNVWVGSPGSSVYKIDTNCSLLDTYPVGNHPRGLAVDGNGYVWAINLGSDSAWKFDPNSNPGDPAECIASVPGSPYAYSSDMTGYTIQRCFGVSPFPDESQNKFLLAGRWRATEGRHAESEVEDTIIINSSAYSDAVHSLMEAECLHKEPESIECHFDCDNPACDAPCGSGKCLGCCSSPSQTCECCPQCHMVYDYDECTYKKYERMYGRPYVDYLFCWKTDLKDTPWCHQTVQSPASAITYPWYGLTTASDKAERYIDKITQGYIDKIHEWNLNQEIREMPDTSVIEYKTWLPSDYCDHTFNSKLFRTIWTKIFTVTPFLNDYRNNMEWTKTGPGAVYAGGGFRREPACWWECCRQCAPFCNCDCTPCGGYCCLNAHYTSGVTETMEFTIPDVDISDTGVVISPGPAMEVTVSNGALTVISTGNMPFQITSAIFTKDVAKGKYILTQVYEPVSDYDQFVITEDIVLNYDLHEDADQLIVGLKETFTTNLSVDTCSCEKHCILMGEDASCPSCCNGYDTGDCCAEDDEGNCIKTTWCCCCPSGSVPISTTESIDDALGTALELDEIKIDALKKGAHDFVDIAVPRGVEVGLVAFESGIRSTLPLTTNISALHTEIDKYYASGGTYLCGGINTGRTLLSGATGEKHMIVMSDGVSNVACGGTPKQDAIDAASASASDGIKVHTIALGDHADKVLMEDIAIAGNGTFYDVTCDCPLDCIYTELANLVNDNAVLVSDVSGSMSSKLSLDCPGAGIPPVHKFGKVNISITGNIDNYPEEEEYITQRGLINITIEPDILNQFTFNVNWSSITHYSLIYPAKHEIFRKEFAHGKWEPADLPYTVIPFEYGYLPGSKTYIFNDSYGYEREEFGYLERCRKICPPNCECPPDDIFDVTCTNYSTHPVSYYKRDDCICMPKDQSYLTPCGSVRTFHEEEGYYYDFVDLVTFEVEDLEVMGLKGPHTVTTGDLTGKVTHLMEPVTSSETTTTTTIY